MAIGLDPGLLPEDITYLFLPDSALQSYTDPSLPRRAKRDDSQDGHTHRCHPLLSI